MRKTIVQNVKAGHTLKDPSIEYIKLNNKYVQNISNYIIHHETTKLNNFSDYS